MKVFNLLLVIVLLILAVRGSHAEDIKVRSFYKDGVVFLRWYPSSYEVYKKCVKDGFIVERREFDSVEGWMPVGEVKKASFDEILKYTKKERNIEILAFVLYENQYLDYLVQQDKYLDRRGLEKRFADMMESGSEAFLYGMTLLQSEFSTYFAKFAALNYMDDKVQTQLQYEYRIRSADASLNYESGVIHTSTHKNDILVPLTKLNFKHSDRLVSFEWKISESLRHDYSGYNLERSEDGINFEVVNEEPIVHLVAEKQKQDVCSYCDTLPDCGKTYYYRICGVSGFGLVGPYSNVVAVKCIDKFTVKTSILGMKATKKNEVRIDWDVMNPDGQEIKGFVVQRSSNGTDSFMDISRMLDGKVRMFVDKNPMKRCYYRVKTYGEDDQFTEGNIDYINVSDTLPPAVPTGLIGSIDSMGVVRLMWNENSDAVRGYKVFFANAPNQRFAPACDTTVFQTFYDDTLYLGSLTNDIYYKVAAIGENYAMSELSGAIKLSKPDTIAPADAVMEEIKQELSGEVKLRWYDSPSRDLVKTKLMRRNADDFEWNTLEEWSGASPQQYVDTTSFKGELVYYCFVVEDESGNQRQSQDFGIKTKYVKPHCIKNFVVEKTDVGIALQWNKCGCGVYATRIYRTDDGNQCLLTTLSAKETGYFDTKVVSGHTYQYMILPMTEKMSEVERSGDIFY